jgi:hypothetical protein
MSKAKYSTDNIGHGLAFDHYSSFYITHRRYPDVMVQPFAANIILMVGNQQIKNPMKLNVYILLQWKVSD